MNGRHGALPAGHHRLCVRLRRGHQRCGRVGPYLENVTAMVAAYEELATGADVTALKPSEITAYISS